MSDPLNIDGSFLRQSRDTLGWSHGELASRACLSIKQVKQLEEGGSSSFYSENVKLTAARKVAQILGVTEDQLLGRHALVTEPEDEQLDQVLNVDSSHANLSHSTLNESELISHDDSLSIPDLNNPNSSDASHESAPRVPILVPGVQSLTMRSEVLHFLAQPPEQSELQNDHDSLTEPEHLGKNGIKEENSLPQTSIIKPQLNEPADTSEPKVQSEVPVATSPSIAPPEAEVSESSSTISNLLKIAILFLLALGVAAYFAQKNAEEHAEAPPPLQVVPEPTSTSSSESAPKTDDQPATGATAGSSATPGNQTPLNAAPAGSTSSPGSVNTKLNNTSSSGSTSAPNSGASSNEQKPKTAQTPTPVGVSNNASSSAGSAATPTNTNNSSLTPSNTSTVTPSTSGN
jgi:transcriptional regulator with XRE-family HTH domain